MLPRPDNRPYGPENSERFACKRGCPGRGSARTSTQSFEGAIAFTPRLSLRGDHRRRCLALDHLLDAVPDQELRAEADPDTRWAATTALVSTEFYGPWCSTTSSWSTDPIVRIVPEEWEAAAGRSTEARRARGGDEDFRWGSTSTASTSMGVDGARLHDRWKAYPHAYLGMAITNFPRTSLPRRSTARTRTRAGTRSSSSSKAQALYHPRRAPARWTPVGSPRSTCGRTFSALYNPKSSRRRWPAPKN